MQRRYRTIPDLKQHERAALLTFSDNELASKLTAMGVRPGVLVEMIRKAPFGAAFYVKIDGMRLAFRADEAACILLEV